jgi:phage terminase large subunit-like protein
LKRSSPPKVRKLTPEGEAKYRRVVRFFETVLRHSKGQHAGEPFSLLPWQHEIFKELFGRLRPDGTRKHRVAYIEVPKKNGVLAPAAGCRGGQDDKANQLFWRASPFTCC